MTTTVMIKDACPACGRTLNRTTSIAVDATPQPGDLSICFGCTTFLKFDQGLKVSALSAQEVLDLAPEERALLARTRAQINEIRGVGNA